MNQEDQTMIITIQNLFENLLSGKQCDTVEADDYAQEWQKLIGQINQMIQNINEMDRFLPGTIICPVPLSSCTRGFLF